MKERGILFSAPMVRALLDGSKTQTRRILKPNPNATETRTPAGMVPLCPYGKVGDRLWVREAWRTVAEADALPPRDLAPAHRLWFEANSDNQPGFGRLRPGMFMPRWASRITLEITGVRVERLQDISEADALAEGCAAKHTADAEYNARKAYAVLWESINGGGSWDANPWVWVVEFRRLPR
jgi:hypothetical protein